MFYYLNFELIYQLSLLISTTYTQQRYFLQKFLLFVFNTRVPDVLPSGLCIKHCMAKDNAYVTDQYQQMAVSYLSMINHL